jgi:SAM-dependent methyltransferase
LLRSDPQPQAFTHLNSSSHLAFSSGSFALAYLAQVPAALAIERLIEGHLLREKSFVRPVLDIGCGDGLFASMLFDDKIDEGLDYDVKETARATTAGRYIHVTTGSATSMPFPDASFATLFSNSVLEHIPGIEQVMSEAFRVLRPGGVFHFTVPTPRFEEQSLPHRLLSAMGLKGAAECFGKAYNSFWRHYNVHNLEGWCSLARAAGFEIQEAHTYCPPQVARLNDLLAPFAFPTAITRRVVDRWVVSPRLREIVLPGLARALENWTRTCAKDRDGVLCCVSAVKPLP